jgi:hypothetical protein
MNPLKGEKIYVNIGRFQIIDTEMIIADPYIVDNNTDYEQSYYIIDPQPYLIINEIKSGYWRSITTVEYYEKWGYRNMELLIYHLEYLPNDIKHGWKYWKNISIDNSTIAIYDRYKLISPEFLNIVKKTKKNSKRTLLLKDGIICQTGFGVGDYPIYVLHDGLEIIGIKILLKNEKLMECVNEKTNERTFIKYNYIDETKN